MSSKTRSLALVAALALVGAGVLSLPMTSPTLAAGSEGAMQGMHRPHTEGRIAFMKAELKITEAQSAVWNKFADTIRANAKAMEPLHAEMMAAHEKPMTALERLEMRQKMMTAGATRMAAYAEAFRPLYAALSPDQKAVADELAARRHGHFRHR